MSHKYAVFRGLFDHAPVSDSSTINFPAAPRAFGLSARDGQSRWRDIHDILNNDPTTKLLIIARHGQGLHNLGQIKYGPDRWSAEMCFQHGDGELTWGPDPPLSNLGKKQAAAVGERWREEFQCLPPIPKPTSFYCSPLRRAAQTLSITFSDVMDINKLVKVRENLREKLDAHTPDQRMNMSVMRDENPDWPVESGAVNEDVYWKEDWVETFEEYSKRAGLIVEEIFKGHDQCPSLTAHEGIIQGLLAAINHPIAQPPPGCAFGVLVKRGEA